MRACARRLALAGLSANVRNCRDEDASIHREGGAKAVDKVPPPLSAVQSVGGFLDFLSRRPERGRQSGVPRSQVWDRGHCIDQPHNGLQGGLPPGVLLKLASLHQAPECLKHALPSRGEGAGAARALGQGRVRCRALDVEGTRWRSLRWRPQAVLRRPLAGICGSTTCDGVQRLEEALVHLIEGTSFARSVELVPVVCPSALKATCRTDDRTRQRAGSRTAIT